MAPVSDVIPVLAKLVLGSIGPAMGQNTRNNLAKDKKVLAVEVVVMGDCVEENSLAGVGKGEGNIPMRMTREEGVEVGGEGLFVTQESPDCGGLSHEGIHNLSWSVRVAL